MSKLEDSLEFQLRALKVTPHQKEYRFAAIACGGTGKGVRQRLKSSGLKDWRFDFAWPERNFAVEVEGGAFTNGRHTRGVGFTEDLRKYHFAVSLNWTVYRCGSELVKSGEAAQLIKTLLLGDQL